MPAVQVRLFAQLRESFGVPGVQLQLSEAADIPALIRALDTHFEALPETVREQLCAANVRIAVNQRLIEGNLSLSDGDEVAFLPPVTGG